MSDPHKGNDSACVRDTSAIFLCLTRALGVCRGLEGVESQFVSSDSHFWVKIGFKFQSLGKISNISTSDLSVLLGQFQHWQTIFFCLIKPTCEAIAEEICPCLKQGLRSQSLTPFWSGNEPDVCCNCLPGPDRKSPEFRTPICRRSVDAVQDRSWFTCSWSPRTTPVRYETWISQATLSIID